MFDGINGLVNADETLPYASKVLTPLTSLLISSIIGLSVQWFSLHVANFHRLYCLDNVCPLFQHNDFYSATKAEGEALILKANGLNGLLTCSLRPSGIFGPGDRLLVPSLVANARAGKSKVSMFIIFVSFFFLFCFGKKHIPIQRHERIYKV